VEDAVANVPAVVDVTGHSLGVAVRGVEMSVLVKRQTPIPTIARSPYSPVSDYQTEVNIQVYQGENIAVADNTHLGEFLLKGLPAKPAGEVTIMVEFALDANGVLTVSARDELTGREAEIEIHDERLKGQRPTVLLPGAGSRSGPSSGQGETTAVPSRYRPFVDQARGYLPQLPADKRVKLQAALDALYAAVRNGRGDAVEKAGDHLMDVLFDVRP